MNTNNLTDRLMGILTFKAPTYKAVAEDKTATPTAAAIVVIVALVTGILGSVFTGFSLGGIIGGVIAVLLAWLIGAFVLAFVAQSFFQGKTDTGEMLRMTGFAQIFSLLGIIPLIGWLLALVGLIVAYVIGIREAAEIDTTKAVLTGMITIVILFFVRLILAIFLH